ncbi:MAG: hypothetical protein PHE74_12890 [Comamonas sp.]|nr:hypothetical protein [Comamonas sp.]
MISIKSTVVGFLALSPLLCFSQIDNNLIYKIHNVTTNTNLVTCNNIGFWLSRGQGSVVDLDKCISDSKEELKISFRKIYDTLDINPEAQKKLKSHYVKSVKTLEELNLSSGENSVSYQKRYEDNKRKIDEAWIAFEVEL